MLSLRANQKESLQAHRRTSKEKEETQYMQKKTKTHHAEPEGSTSTTAT